MNSIRSEIIIGSIITVMLAIMVGYAAGKYEAQERFFAQDRKAPVETGQTPNDTSATILTSETVAQHATATDCWVILDNGVYNVANYLQLHPGGAERITPFCGKDATTAFQTKDGSGTHSNKAWSDLAQLKVGEIGTAVVPRDQKPLTPTPNPAPTPSTKPTRVQPVSPVTIALTTTEVAKHSTATDCWVIYSGSVYNATNYLTLHPGGASRIIPFCGKDMTQAFATQGGGGSHSQGALADLAQLKLGTLNSTVPTTNVSNTAAAPQQGGFNTDGEVEYEDD